jgi:Xaa-Pro aminopeptidase
MIARRERVAAAWSLTDEVVLIAAGESVSIPGGADQTYPFVSHSDYYYLTEYECPGAVVAYDPKSGWIDFVPEVTEAERVWEGRTDAPGTPLSQLGGWLASRRGRAIVTLGAGLPGLRGAHPRAAALAEALLHARRPKDAVEAARLRAASAATAAGYASAVKFARAGVTERQVQIELEAGFFRGGGTRTGYGTIVGAGTNSAVLHFEPGARVLAPGDTLLIDAGAEIDRYTADVTRTYRIAGGSDEGFFKSLYEVVLGMETRGIDRCVAGAEWRDIHMAACREAIEGLVALGLMKGATDALLERDAHALFFPHGLGHMVGLGVRDASGYLPGRVRSNRPGLNMLRTDLPLEPGYCITVEPGLYFIPALLTDAGRREKFADAVVWSKVDALLGFGGIRIEDDVLVTNGAPEVLTAAIPKDIGAALLR